MTNDVVRLSKRLSWLLRHGAGESHLTMDTAGWAPVSEVLTTLSISQWDLDQAVAFNDKGRLEVRDVHIRACQGHSLERMPVTQEGLEASWQVLHPTESLWHGTRSSAIEGIADAGISAGSRSHVHLAPHPDSKVGKRSSVDYLIEIDPDALTSASLSVYRAPNGVILVRYVPVVALKGLRAITMVGKRFEAQSCELLGVPAREPQQG